MSSSAKTTYETSTGEAFPMVEDRIPELRVPRTGGFFLYRTV